MPVYSEVVSINWVSEMFRIQHSSSHSIFNNNEKICELIKGYYYVLPFRTPKDAVLFLKNVHCLGNLKKT